MSALDEKVYSLTHAELKRAILSVADEIVTYERRLMGEKYKALTAACDAAIEASKAAIAEQRAELDRIRLALERIQQGDFGAAADTLPEIH
jgi:RNA polymerase-binding transcription factor DksA